MSAATPKKETMIMNRKAYRKPAMQVVNLKTRQQLLAVSDINGNAGLNYGGGGSGSARSRGFGGWDDDWDEE